MNKLTLAALIFSIIGILVVLRISTPPSPSTQTTAATSPQLLTSSEFMSTFKKTGGAILLDVRTPDEFASGHINGAQNVDYENPNFSSQISQLDPTKTYFVYCRSGNRSSKAVQIMKQQNFKNIYELRGGIASAPNLLQQ